MTTCHRSHPATTAVTPPPRGRKLTDRQYAILTKVVGIRETKARLEKILNCGNPNRVFKVAVTTRKDPWFYRPRGWKPKAKPGHSRGTSRTSRASGEARHE